MSKVIKLLEQMRNSSASVRFSDLCKVCDCYFGEPRQNSTSHRIYKTPWEGKPWVNIQRKGSMAKEYQVEQVLEAIDKLDELEELEKQ